MARTGKITILVGDIGGTNTRLAIIEAVKGHFHFLSEDTFSSREEPSLESSLRKFLLKSPHAIVTAAFGVAGPVYNGRCEATNLPWVIDSQVLAKQLSLPSVGLINDWEVGAYGIDLLEDKDFEVLNPGSPEARGNRAVIAAGTGLGEVALFWDGKDFRPFATEGGHADFAPRNHLEMELLNYLLKRHPRVSIERAICGQGLYTIYQFLKDRGQKEEPKWLSDQLRKKDPPAVISTNALAGKNPLCMEALDLFVSLYGAEAGNMALKVMAAGGIYLGGGIAPKILAKLKDPVFMNAFTAKGRMRPLLQAIPVRVILNTKVALLGAARYALIQ
ncbi:MAG TPA: glucokinase [Thermodesulfobacteriota bacterium]|nr:glucokinase [Thermodesulfobacteriota bacterium]